MRPVMPRTLIFGGDSVVGQALTAMLMANGCPEIRLTTRREIGTEADQARPNDCRVTFHRCDVRDQDTVMDVCDAFFVDGGGAAAGVVYCCGSWMHGRIADINLDRFRDMFDVMVTAPLTVAQAVARTSSTSARLVVLTGSGGGNAVSPGNFAYNTACEATRYLVATLGEEWASQHPMKKHCLGIALGLVDKGQRWVHSYRRAFPNEIAPDFNEAITIVGMFLNGHLTGANGSTLRLAHNSFSYRSLIAMKERGEI